MERALHAFIFHRKVTNEKASAFCTGESLLLRHLRMLRDYSVSSVTILTDDSVLTKERVDELYRFYSLCIFCRAVHNLDASTMGQLMYEECKHLSASGADALFFDSSCILAGSLFRLITENNSPCLFLVDRKNSVNIHPPSARLDMDRVVQISNEISGVGTFGLFPLVRMDASAMAQLCLLHEGSRLRKSPDILCLIGNILPLFKFFALSSTPHFASVLRNNTDMRALSIHASLSDYEDHQSLYTGPGCILNMIDLLQRARPDHTLILFDSSCDRQLIEYILQQSHTAYVFCEVNANSSPENWSHEVTEQVQLGMRNIIVSAGSSRTIALGKSLRLHISLLQGNTALEKEAIYASLRHVAIPVGQPSNEVVNGTCSVMLGNKQTTLFSPHLLPTDVFLDSDLMDISLTQEDRTVDKSLMDAYMNARNAGRDRLSRCPAEQTDLRKIWAAK